MLTSRRLRRAAPSLALLLTLGLPLAALSACSGDEEGAGADSEPTPAEVLAQARTTLDETPGVQFALTTEALPEGVTGITSATGVATHAPAFEGEFAVVIAGNSFDVPVVAVDGEVFVQLPLTPSFQAVDPAEYGAPDPLSLIDPEDGVSGLLAATEDLAEGESVRGGANNEEILTEYTGTVPGEAMSNVIPSAEGDFEVVYTVTDEGELRAATLTGVFYPSTEAMTYDLALTDYGTEQDVVAP